MQLRLGVFVQECGAMNNFTIAIYKECSAKNVCGNCGAIDKPTQYSQAHKNQQGRCTEGAGGSAVNTQPKVFDPNRLVA